MTVTVSGSQITFNDNSTQNTAATGFGFKNRIINPAMVIDQRNAGASVTVSNAVLTYPVDRFFAFQNTGSSSFTVQRTTVVPSNFNNSLLWTTTTGVSTSAAQQARITQRVEGFNVADLGWGTASAQTVTFSFWVRSSITGTFAAALLNSAGNRAYVATFTVSAANTWEKETITIPGDTSGTWLTDNSTGIQVVFDLGSGSNFSTTAGSWAAGEFFRASGTANVIGTTGATFYITGVQLEKGSTATSFDYRPYGTELALCQRYYEKSYEISTVPGSNTYIGMIHVSGTSNSFGDMLTMLNFQVQKRAAPTMTFYREDGTNGSWNMERSGSSTTPTVNSGSVGDHGGRLYCATGANWTAASIKGQYTASAEL